MEATVLIVPGIRDHVEDHWQTLLAAEVPRAVIVPPLEGNRLSSAARIDAVEAAIKGIEGPVIIVGHSAGVVTVVQWAAIHASKHDVRGALLAAPADVETPFPDGYPRLETLRENGWIPIPREILPFPTIVVASENDHLAELDRVVGMANDWGADTIVAGAVGHLNPAAGYGSWPLAYDLVKSLEAGLTGAA